MYSIFQFTEFTQYFLNLETQKQVTLIWIECVIVSMVFLTVLYSFICSSFKSPGRTPNKELWKMKYNHSKSSDQLDILTSISSEREEQLSVNCDRLFSENGKEIFIRERSDDCLIKYCKYCLLFQPDRSHHCKVCNSCCLKFDHHCPMLNNCIGYSNYSDFVLLNTCGLISGILYFYLFTIPLHQFISNRDDISIGKTMAILYSFLIVILLISLIFFCIFHYYIILCNFTTYEYIAKVIRKREKEISEYNIGLFNNVMQVFAQNWGSYKGITFNVVDEGKKQLSYYRKEVIISI